MAHRLGGEVRKIQIAEAALTLAADGLKAITVENVARLVGIVPSALYRHFKNKSEILDAVQELLQNRIMDNVRLASEEASTPIETLKRFLVRHVRLFMDNPGLTKIMFSDEITSREPGRREKMRGVQKKFFGAVTRIIIKGQNNGGIRADADPEDLTFMFFGLLLPPIYLHHLTNRRFDLLGQTTRNWELYRLFLETGKQDESEL